MKKFLSNLILGKIVYTAKTNVEFNRVIEALKQSITNNNFNITAIHDLKETFVKNKLHLNNDFEYKIIQICNAQKAHTALTSISYDLGIMMPKSIIVAKEKGKTSLRFMQMKPWMVSMMFPEADISSMSKNVMAIMKKIVTETINNVEKN